MARKRRTLHVLTIIVVLFIGLILGSLLGEPRLTERVKELQKENEHLRGWLEGNITAYGNQIEAYKDRIELLNKQIKLLNEQIEILNEKLEIEILGVYFSPRGGCAEAIISLIGSANKSIHILIYSFTLDSIGNALIEAFKRGVDVRVVFERNEISEYSEYWRLKGAGVLVRNDTNPYLMHNKVMVVDSKIVVTGSYNWSGSAEERNDENIIIIRSRRIAEEYEKTFEKIWAKSFG
ncbi:MAG: phospholipase D family protein [Candidatus Bathyarchaeia archaeon]